MHLHFTDCIVSTCTVHNLHFVFVYVCSCVFVCVIVRWVMTGTWRVVSRSVCVKVEV